MKRIAGAALVFLSASAGLRAAAAGDTSSVYFPFNEAVLPAAMIRHLDSALNYGPLNRPGSFLIYGHTDAVGTEGYNEGLSRKRALYVKGILLSRGVADSDIRILTGLGERAAGLASKPDDRPQDRRVDVILATPEPDLPQQPQAERIQRFAPGNDTLSLPGRRRDSASRITELIAGESLVLENVYFYPGRHKVRPESYSQLEDLYQALVDHPTMAIRIEGHVCCIDPRADDALDNDTRRIELSVNRARAIRTMLIERGIAAERIEAVGFGYRYPIFRNEENEEQANRNRRVEVRILKR